MRTEREILRKAAAYFAQETIRSAASGSSPSTETPTASSGSVESWESHDRGWTPGRPRFMRQRSVNDAELARGDHRDLPPVALHLWRSSRAHRASSGPLAKRCGPQTGRSLDAGYRQLVGVHARRQWHTGPSRHCAGSGSGGPQLQPEGPGPIVGRGRHPVPHRARVAVLGGGDELWSRRVVGWSMDTSVTAALVCDALVMVASWTTSHPVGGRSGRPRCRSAGMAVLKASSGYPFLTKVEKGSDAARGRHRRLGGSTGRRVRARTAREVGPLGDGAQRDAARAGVRLRRRSGAFRASKSSPACCCGPKGWRPAGSRRSALLPSLSPSPTWIPSVAGPAAAVADNLRAVDAALAHEGPLTVEELWRGTGS